MWDDLHEVFEDLEKEFGNEKIDTILTGDDDEAADAAAHMLLEDLGE